MSDEDYDPYDPGYPPDDEDQSSELRRIALIAHDRREQIDERYRQRLHSLRLRRSSRWAKVLKTSPWLLSFFLIILAQIAFPWIATRLAQNARDVFGLIMADVIVVSVIVATTGFVRFLLIRAELRVVHREIELNRLQMQDVEEQRDWLVDVYRDNPNLFEGRR